MGNKFILEWDEINPNSESDEKGEERKDWITTVEHDPADRQPDGRWEGTIVQMRVPVRLIRWEGFTDRNNGKLYATNSTYQKAITNGNTEQIKKAE